MTPKYPAARYCIGDHVWADCRYTDGIHVVLIRVYDKPPPRKTSRFFVLYENAQAWAPSMRVHAPSRDEFIVSVLGALEDGTIELPLGFDLEDALDSCEYLL